MLIHSSPALAGRGFKPTYLMKIDKEWSAHVDALEEARRRLEEALTLVPDAGTGRKCRQAVERSWKKVVETSDAIEELIGSSVQPLPVEFPWQDAEFRQAWQTYKEYLEEQHHIVMESRMEIARLKLIRQFAKNQRAAAIAAIEFYMALGTANVFEINTNDEKQDDNGKKNITVIPIS